MGPKRMSPKKPSLEHILSDSPIPQIEKLGFKRNSTLNMPSPAKPSRLQPNQPLHMTTRRAASTAATQSTTVSITSADSRRSSLGDTTQLAGGSDIDADRPTKRARLSDHSSTTSGTKSAVRHSGSATPIPNGSNQDANIPDILATPEPSNLGASNSVTPPEEDSLLDERQDDDESDVQRLLSPLPRRRGRRPKLKRAITPTGSVADSLILGTPLNGDLDDNDSDHDLPKAARRLPGRRRAPNADPYLEACLRRQLQLRMGHRAVSKALKSVLIELSIRTSERLEAHYENGDGDSNGDGYSDDYDDGDHEFLEIEQQLVAELDGRLNARLRVLANELRITASYHDGRLEKDEEYLKMQYMDRVATLQEDFIARAENRILDLVRQYEHELDNDATDDENGALIRSLHGRPNFQNPTGRLDAPHDSRSRFFLEIERLGVLTRERIHIGKEQEIVLRDNNTRAMEGDEDAILVASDQLPEGFGSTDQTRRQNAVAALNVQNLAFAATAIELEELERQKPPIPVISNMEASGLQALSAAIEFGPEIFSNLGNVQIHAGQFPHQHLPSEPSVKLEHAYQDLPAHAYPAAPVTPENGYHPQMTSEPHIHDPVQIIKPPQSVTNPPLTSKAAIAQPIYSHKRTASESAKVSGHTPTQYDYHRLSGYTTSAASSSGSLIRPPLGGAEIENSPIRSGGYGPPLTRILESRGVGQNQPSVESSETSEERISGLIWNNVLADSKVQRNLDHPELSRTEESHRRRSEANIGASHTNGSFGHARKHSAPVITEINSFRIQSPPPTRSPQAPQTPWRQQDPTSQTGRSTSSQPPTIYYQSSLPQFTVPYVLYAPPAPPSAVQQQPPQQQHGIFFGPPPPPQFGPPAGPQQQFPWYRQ